MLGSLLFLLLLFIPASAAQDASSLRGKRICNPLQPADTNSLVWDATVGCWKPGVGGNVTAGGNNVFTGSNNFSNSTAFIIRFGTTAPSSSDCDAAGERGNLYLRSGDPATIPTRVSICVQTGASSYAWMPVSYKVGTTAPATCDAGEVFFDSDATAGQNWYGCTSANTWTLLSGGGSSAVEDLQSGAAYTLLTSDCGKRVVVSNAAPTVTVPAASGFADGCVIQIQPTAGDATLITGVSVTVHRNQTATIASNNSQWRLIYTQVNNDPGGYVVWSYDVNGVMSPVFQTGLDFNWTGSHDFSAGASMRLKTGSGTPSSGDCDAAGEVGRVYMRTNASAANATYYVCSNTGASTYAWELAQGGGTTTSSGAYASLPAAGTAGRLYYPTDGNCDVLRDTGSVWECFIRGVKVTVPPTASWTNINSPTSFAASGSGMKLVVPANGTMTNYEWRGSVRAVPATPWEITLSLDYIDVLGNAGGSASSKSSCAMVLTDGTTAGSSKMLTFGAISSDGSFYWGVSYYATINATTIGSTPKIYGVIPQSIFSYLRIADDGSTNLTFSASKNGVDFQSFGTLGRTAHFASGPTHVGIACSAGNDIGLTATLLTYSTTTGAP